MLGLPFLNVQQRELMSVVAVLKLMSRVSEAMQGRGHQPTKHRQPHHPGCRGVLSHTLHGNLHVHVQTMMQMALAKPVAMPMAPGWGEGHLLSSCRQRLALGQGEVQLHALHLHWNF
jgi:hypothetical protein